MIDPTDLYRAPLDNAPWHKSSYTANASNCVEIAPIPSLPAVAVRDSKNPQLPAVRASRRALRAFADALLADDLEPA